MQEEVFNQRGTHSRAIALSGGKLCRLNLDAKASGGLLRYPCRDASKSVAFATRLGPQLAISKRVMELFILS